MPGINMKNKGTGVMLLLPSPKIISASSFVGWLSFYLYLEINIYISA